MLQVLYKVINLHFPVCCVFTQVCCNAIAKKLVLTCKQSSAKVATEKNEPVANATGGRAASRSPSSTGTVEPAPPQSPPVRSVAANGGVPPASPSETASSPSQTVVPDDRPTVMAGPTATAPVLTWSPLLFPPWNTALLPAAFYPVAALRSLPG